MTIKLYWCRGKGRSDEAQRNFGDYLSPLLVEMLSGKRVEYAPVHKADLMALGSILPRERKAKRFFMPRHLHIWGAGTDASGLSFSSRHHYHALRGQKSVEQVRGLQIRPALGDPGLLANQWWGARTKPEKRYRVGVIPHYVDKDSPYISALLKEKGVLLIDVFAPVEDVLRAIQSCEFIFSSSMHGLIVSDSFGIPNRRVKFSEGKISDYKFVDYYSAFSMSEPSPLTVQGLLSGFSAPDMLVGEYSRPGLSDLQAGLRRSFPDL